MRRKFFLVNLVVVVFYLLIDGGSTMKFQRNHNESTHGSSDSSPSPLSHAVDDVLLLAELKNDDDGNATDVKHSVKRRSGGSSFLPNTQSSSSSGGFSSFRDYLHRHPDEKAVRLTNPSSSSSSSSSSSFSSSNFRPHRKEAPHQKMPFRYTREVQIKQGKLVGIVREMSPQLRLKNVHQFLGIPYAEAPVESRRFMPPSPPLAWQGVKYANKMGDVCPQKLPNLADSSGFTKGRYDQIKRLLPFLTSESEDCLYLNLYVTSNDDGRLPQNYPVIVFLHESFEWNSGNPYDGSILASYGQVIVITLNYRLGALGFMKPGLKDQSVANFGLLDIVAALQWIKENIEAFGGNKNSVTLLGFDHGAIIANFLMISPVANGLFHRSILMSGSALSDWALNYNPQQITLQVAKKLNCPIEDSQLGDCLRRKKYEEITNISVTVESEFLTIFGPIVDGLVVPSDVYQVMAHGDSLGRFDLLFGLTELESYFTLGRNAIQNGMSQTNRDYYIRNYLSTRFDKRLEVAFLSTLKEYNTFQNTKSMSFGDHRDMLLEILSDARVAAPLIQTGIYLSKRNPRCYMYVFGHNAEAGEHATISQSVHGEDLPFVFGAPLADVGPFGTEYSLEERLLSEAMMRYFSNFAKTGNPTVPWPQRFHNLNPSEWDRFDVDWQEFNEINQNYLLLDTRPTVSQRYRHNFAKFWNEGLHETMTNSLSQHHHGGGINFGKLSNLPATPRTMPNSHISVYPIKVEIERPTMDPISVLRNKLRDSPSLHQPYQQHHHQYNIPDTTTSTSATESINYVEKERHELFEGSTLYLLISVIVTFLAINILALVIYLYRRRNKKINRKYDSANVFDAVSGVGGDDKRSKFNDTDESFILDMLRKSSNNTYESVKRHSPINGYGGIGNRQTSTSTVDTHTKVNDWICNSPRRQQSSSFASSTLKREKVSVAVDATPQARSNSILRQEPIEVTKAKSLDYGWIGGGGGSGGKMLICQEVDMDVSMIDEIPFRSSNGCCPMNGGDDDGDSSSCSCSSFSHCEECAMQQSSYVDPHKMPYHQIPNPHLPEEEITSFIEDDVNVTSRDSVENSSPLSPEESLKAIQKMNCPKVLPKYPENIQLNDATKRRSLQVPPQYYQIHGDIYNQVLPSAQRPDPPPRLSSTLGRRPHDDNRASFFMTKPEKAEEPPSTLTENSKPTQLNTLIFGPLVPKPENIYVSMQRRKSLSRQNSTTSSHANSDNDVINQENSSSAIQVAAACKDYANDNQGEHLYSEVIKNSRVQQPQDGIYSITTAATSNSSKQQNHERRKSSSNNSQESNSSTSSSESSTGTTIRKIN